MTLDSLHPHHPLTPHLPLTCMFCCWLHTGCVARLVRWVLLLYFYWVNMAPLSRGSAAVGLGGLVSHCLACGISPRLPLPYGRQLDWEAILTRRPQDFLHLVAPLLFPHLDPSFFPPHDPAAPRPVTSTEHTRSSEIGDEALEGMTSKALIELRRTEASGEMPDSEAALAACPEVARMYPWRGELITQERLDQIVADADKGTLPDMSARVRCLNDLLYLMNVPVRADTKA